MTTEEQLKSYADNIAIHLQSALQLAQQMQQLTHSTEGDSDLHRKLAFYLVPNLTHWISGAQAGGVKDLDTTLEKRKK